MYGKNRISNVLCKVLFFYLLLNYQQFFNESRKLQINKRLSEEGNINKLQYDFLLEVFVTEKNDSLPKCESIIIIVINVKLCTIFCQDGVARVKNIRYENLTEHRLVLIFGSFHLRKRIEEKYMKMTVFKIVLRCKLFCGYNLPTRFGETSN